MANARLKKIAAIKASEKDKKSQSVESGLDDMNSSSRKPQSHLKGNARQTTMTMAQGRLTSIENTLTEEGISLEEFLIETKKLDFTQAGRSIKSIDGTTYKAIQRTLSYDEIIQRVRIDDANVREQSSRNMAQLNKMADEIEYGMQISPVLAYQADDGLIYVVDGSCRTDIAKDKRVGLDFEILDHIPTPETITWLVASSDIKTAFNYYEKGNLYSRLMEVNGWSAYTLEQKRLYNKDDISLSTAIFTMPGNLKNLFVNYSFTSREAKFLRKLIVTLKDSEVKTKFSKWISNHKSQLETLKVEQDNKKIIELLKEWMPVTKKPSAVDKTPQTWVKSGKTSVVYKAKSEDKGTIELANIRPDQVKKIKEFFDDLITE